MSIKCGLTTETKLATYATIFPSPQVAQSGRNTARRNNKEMQHLYLYFNQGILGGDTLYQSLV